MENEDGNNFNEEENLFNTIENNNYDDDEDNGDLGYDENSFSQYENNDEEEDEDEDEDKGQDNSIFNNDDEDEDEEQDDEDEEQEFSQKELDAFNKKLGTDFKTVNDLKDNFKSKDSESDQSKEEAEYGAMTNKIALYDRYIGMDNEQLIRNQLVSQASADKKDINSNEVNEEIDEKLAGLADLGQLDSMAETLRSNLQSQKDKTQGSIDVIDNKRTAATNEVARKATDDLQNAFSDMLNEKTFMGVTLTKEDILETYENIRSDKFFKDVNSNQEMIAKFAMFVKYEKQISKLTNAPTHSDKTKGAFNFLSENGPGKSRSIASAKGSASSGNANDNLMNFVK
jgi:hypothetical protein